jgi:hypothetical protein
VTFPHTGAPVRHYGPLNGEVCEHKDCERTDASPVEFMLYRRGELVDQRTFYFCLEHRKALHALKTTPTLPPRNGSRAPIPTYTARAPAVLFRHLGATARR